VNGRKNFTGVLRGVVDEMIQIQLDNETVISIFPILHGHG
jgi:hypothetical protein